jgi:hypothetical protein
VTLQRAPKVDRRTAAEIAEALRRRLRFEQDDALGNGLIAIFARYCEILIQRLNRAPDKQFLAFLDLLGVSPVPPSAAGVPLTFKPVTGLPPEHEVVAVPRHTRVAAPPPPGAKVPVVFETEQPLLLTDALLARVLALEPAADSYTDCPEPAACQADSGEGLFGAARPQAHELYIAQNELFTRHGLARLGLEIEPGGDAPGGRLEWFIPGAGGEITLAPLRDGTRGLTRSGELVFTDLPEWPVHTLFGRQDRWLGCRLLGPSLRGRKPLCIRRLRLNAEWALKEAEVEQAFCNRLPLESGGELLPLGERPRRGDACYFGSPAFAHTGARLVLKIRLANPAGADPAHTPLPPVYSGGQPRLAWEAWDGRRWRSVACRDGTSDLTVDGRVVVTLPGWLQPSEINGASGHWLRARLAAGHYGEDERLALEGGQLRRIPATLAPPLVTGLSLEVTAARRQLAPTTLLTRNGPRFQDLGADAGPFLPFPPAEDTRRCLYLGLRLPAGRVPSGRPLDLYLEPGPTPGRAQVRGADSQPPGGLRWQYWNGSRWRPCPAQDGSDGLRRPGTVRLQPGADLSPWRECALEGTEGLYWLRSLLNAPVPLPRRLLLNTVPARHVLTLENELLGSSTGKPSQMFRCHRSPVLEGLVLEVREPDLPEDQELAALRVWAGDAAVREERDQRGRLWGAWVRWQEMADLLDSGPGDRHFLLDRRTGQIRFGDGRQGRIPPTGSNNLRLRRYRSGGGSVGNRPAASITQLRSSLPFVTSVTNSTQATGGRDGESQARLLERGAQLLRHRGRAVTAADYDDLARMASPAVARASCHPLRDLAADPDGRAIRPGAVSVVVVPHGDQPAPRPDPELLRRVHAFLTLHGSPGIGLEVLAPEYLQVGVEAELVPGAAPAADLIGDGTRRLERFLHPLRGGDQGGGWRYGEQPRRSDLLALLETAPGVDHVHALRITTREERPGLERSGLFLVCAGQIKLKLRTALAPGGYER